MIYDANFLAAFRKRSTRVNRTPAPAVPTEKTTEMDFAQYAGQLRPWTYQDATVVWELEQELIAALDRAEARQTVCDCYWCLYMKGQP